MKFNLSQARIAFLLYAALLFAALAFMIAMLTQHDSWGGLFAVLLTLPWSMSVIIFAFIFPNGTPIAISLLVFVVSGAINLVLMWRWQNKLKQTTVVP